MEFLGFFREWNHDCFLRVAQVRLGVQSDMETGFALPLKGRTGLRRKLTHSRGSRSILDPHAHSNDFENLAQRHIDSLGKCHPARDEPCHSLRVKCI